MGGLVIGGKRISNLRYANDTTLFIGEREILELIQKVEKESSAFGLELNRQKTKLIIIDRTNKLKDVPSIQGMEVVEEIIYLGVFINREGSSSTEIRRRITTTKTAMTKLKKNIERHQHYEQDKTTTRQCACFSGSAVRS